MIPWVFVRSLLLSAVGLPGHGMMAPAALPQQNGLPLRIGIPTARLLKPTIRHCDRIIVLDGGKIAEDGSYNELIARGGLFAELVSRQRVDLP